MLATSRGSARTARPVRQDPTVVAARRSPTARAAASCPTTTFSAPPTAQTPVARPIGVECGGDVRSHVGLQVEVQLHRGGALGAPPMGGQRELVFEVLPEEPSYQGRHEAQLP
jgi:hypothetical protein